MTGKLSQVSEAGFHELRFLPDFSLRIAACPADHVFRGDSRLTVRYTLAMLNAAVEISLPWHVFKPQPLSGMSRKHATWQAPPSDAVALQTAEAGSQLPLNVGRSSPRSVIYVIVRYAFDPLIFHYEPKIRIGPLHWLQNRSFR